MEEKEKIIKLICEIDKVYDLYMCDCGCCLDVIKNFLDELNNIFDDTLNISLLKYIKGLDTRVFTDKYFCCSKFNNNNFNMIRDFINDPNTNGKKIEIPYNLLLKYIEKDYLLIKYIDALDDYKLINLGSRNPMVLYKVEEFSCAVLLEVLKNNRNACLILDGDILLDESLKNTYLYKNRNKFLKDPEVYNLYVGYLKEYLEHDVIKYANLSFIARSDLDLALYVLRKDYRLLAYTMPVVRKDKNIMMEMIRLDKANVYYLDECLKSDNDITKLIFS